MSQVKIEFQASYDLLLILDGDHYIKKIDRKDYRVNMLLKQAYLAVQLPEQLINEVINESNQGIVTIGLFKRNYESGEDFLMVTISAKLKDFNEIKEFFSKTEDVGFKEIFNIFKSKQSSSYDFVEITRFASIIKGGYVKEYFYLIIAYLVYCINRYLVKDASKYLLYSNTNKVHAMLYGSFFENEIVSTKDSIMLNGLECCINIYTNREKTKHIKDYYDSLIRKINEEMIRHAG